MAETKPATGSASSLERPVLPQVLIITGPTAVGKTAVGLRLAQRLGGEIISADSVQVYRTLDVGSDKLPLDQRQGIPHHLIDVRDPTQEFSAAEFHDLARTITREIIKRGKVPIVVGGTGFYLRWFTHGKTLGPKATPEAVAHVQQSLQQTWQQLAEQQGQAELAAEAKWEAGVNLLTAWGDPESAARILQERNNYYRLERALAIVHMTGKKLSELDVTATATSKQQGQSRGRSQGGSDRKRHQPDSSKKVPAVDALEPAVCSGEPEKSNASLSMEALPPSQLNEGSGGIAAEQPQDVETASALNTAPAGPQTSTVGVSEPSAGRGTEPGAKAEANEFGYTDFEPGSIGDGEFDFRPFFLNRMRTELYDRIGERCEEMIFTGLLDEAAALLLQGLAPGCNNASRAVGYRQAMLMLQAGVADGGTITAAAVEQCVRDMLSATHRLVRSQMTWFRDDSVYRWLEISGCSTDDVVERIEAEAAMPVHQGGCGSSGRLSLEDQKALKRYRPDLPRLQKAQLVSELLEHVNGNLMPRLVAAGQHPAHVESHKRAVTTVES